jgi:ubiquinone biosynthesis protein UbiJ
VDERDEVRSSLARRLGRVPAQVVAKIATGITRRPNRNLSATQHAE